MSATEYTLEPIARGLAQPASTPAWIPVVDSVHGTAVCVVLTALAVAVSSASQPIPVSLSAGGALVCTTGTAAQSAAATPALADIAGSAAMSSTDTPTLQVSTPLNALGIEAVSPSVTIVVPNPAVWGL